MENTFTLKVDAGKLTGTITMGQMGEAPISEGKVDGDNVSFAVVREFNGNQFRINYKGKVAGGRIRIRRCYKRTSGIGLKHNAGHSDFTE